MKNNDIKLIYGKNGAGKTRYADACKENEKKYFVIDSNGIKSWLIKSDNEGQTFSEYFSIKNGFEKEIEEKWNILKSNKSELSKQINKGSDLSSFCDAENFSDWRDVINYFNIENNKLDEEIDENITLNFYELVKENKDLFNELKKWNKDQFYSLYIKNILLKEWNDDSKIYKIINKESKLKDYIFDTKNNIEKKLLENFDNKENINNIFEKLSHFKKIDIIKLIETFFEKEPKVIDDFVIKKIKNKIVNSKEFREIIDIYERGNNKLKNSFIFNNEDIPHMKKYKISNDGRSLFVSNKNSNGQKTFIIVSAIISSLKNENKILILDDICETLDVNNHYSFINELIKNNLKNIEILTHSIETFEIISDLFKRNSEALITSIINNSDIKNIDVSLSFCSLNNNIIDSIFGESTKSCEKKNIILNFSKLFARYLNKSGSLIEFSKSEWKTSNGDKAYRFSSENLFHYEEDINIKNLNDIFNTKFDFKIGDNKRIDTVLFFEMWINDIKRIKNIEEIKFGISVKGILIFLESILNILKIEKKIIEYGKKAEIDLNGLSKNRKIKKIISFIYEKEESDLNIDIKKYNKNRNKLIHSIDYTLINIVDFEN